MGWIFGGSATGGVAENVPHSTVQIISMRMGELSGYGQVPWVMRRPWTEKHIFWGTLPPLILNRPSAVASYLQLRYPVPEQEVAGALFLDGKCRLIADKVLFRGTRHRCDINPEPFLRHALLLGAYAIIVFHTHPSGDPKPSGADVVFTKRLDEACELVGVRFVDHLVLGEPAKWTSVRQAGILKME